MDILHQSEEPEFNTEKASREIDKWIISSVDKYIVKSIDQDCLLMFKFLDNTVLNGKVRWFNKYNINFITSEGVEYMILKHSLKYMVKID